MKTMQKQNLQTLKGFRDFLPPEKRVRDLVVAKIKATFERFGFEPLETPTLEYAELLLGKYGDEADKLVYSFEDRGGRQIALRYDQTVPTARVLSQYQNELGKGFRRYQIQPVFRADKPQKGRYREFVQCDADIFGVTSSLADAEILAVYYNIYKNLGLPDIIIDINDRESLIDLIGTSGLPKDKTFSVIQSLDKLDKQTPEYVRDELLKKGVTLDQFTIINKLLQELQPSNKLKEIISLAIQLGIPENNINFARSLARGLDYYTGMIFEGKIPGESGSVGGGGRYDNLIESLGGPAIPAVGFGLGFDRTIEVLTSRNLVASTPTTQALVTIFPRPSEAGGEGGSPSLQGQALQVAQSLREAGINTELYPDPSDKLDKQFKYADKKAIPYAIVIGEEEIKNNTITLKNLATREQITLPVSEAIANLKI